MLALSLVKGLSLARSCHLTRDKCYATRDIPSLATSAKYFSRESTHEQNKVFASFILQSVGPLNAMKNSYRKITQSFEFYLLLMYLLFVFSCCSNVSKCESAIVMSMIGRDLGLRRRMVLRE